MFRTRTGIAVKVIAVGSGAALEMARRGDADAVLVHAPENERSYVESGDLVLGRLIMHNDFVIVGPADDPAGIRGLSSLRAAMSAIARHGWFVSRGDGSGTEAREMAAWREAGIDRQTLREREETGQGMGATLRVTDQRRSYTLTDRGTYLALRRSLALDVLYEGDPALLNVYHAYIVNPDRHPGVKRADAAAFVEFLASPETQLVIAEFGRGAYGQPLFVPDAGKDSTVLRGSGKR